MIILTITYYIVILYGKTHVMVKHTLKNKKTDGDGGDDDYDGDDDNAQHNHATNNRLFEVGQSLPYTQVTGDPRSQV